MDPVIVPVLTVLAGLAVRGMAVAELLVLLWWRERQERAHRSYLTALVRGLPGGSRVDEVRPGGGELHLVLAYPAGTAGRPSR
jgi:hypothetical protein